MPTIQAEALNSEHIPYFYWLFEKNQKQQTNYLKSTA